MKKQSLAFALALIPGLISAGPVQAAAATPTVIGTVPAPDAQELLAFQAATRKLYDLKEKAFSDGKVGPIVERFYAENARSIGPDGKPYQGRAAFTENYAKLVPNYVVKVEPASAYVSGNAGWEWANFRVMPKDPASAEKPFTFAILFLWMKVGGDWVCAGDFYTIGEFPTE